MADNLNDLNWLPIQLPENVKIIVTVSSEATNLDKCENDDSVLKILKEKLNGAQFVHLNHFSMDQWKDILLYGGGDFYAANGALHLPEIWQSSTEKIPLQAKVVETIYCFKIDFNSSIVVVCRFSGGWHG